MEISRRQFLKRFVLTTAFTGAAAGLASVLEPAWIKTTSYDLASPKWPKDMPPLRIAVAADFHVGCPSVSLATVEKISSRLNAMKPDIILLLGDFLTAVPDEDRVLLGEYVEPEPIAARLQSLNAPLGVFAVLGNHDWACDGEGMWNALGKAGIGVLENNALNIRSLKHNFWIAGLADDTTRKSDIGRTFAKITNDDPVILMTHDPGTFLDRNGRPVVTLAGHTHGGQIALPLLGTPAHVVGRAPKRYMYGHIVEGGEDLIVTSGLGTSFMPVRLGPGTVPELIMLTIGPGP